MDTLQIPQLIFSTRAARPESGTEFNRQVISATPGLPDAVHSAFSALADGTYTLAQQRQLEPVLAFSPLGATSWIFCRAKSLGRYRGSGHHMLVHGLVLRRSDLEPLQFNPFLLVDDALQEETGFSFRETHPGAMRELPPIEMSAQALRVQAPGWNRRRFEARRQEMAEFDPAFPQLFDQICKGRTVAWVDEGPPDPRRIEWCLLHFHPEDRLELPFHTWYVYGRRHAIRLLMVTRSELSRLRPLFQDLAIWPPAKPRPQDASTVAQLTQELWRQAPEKFHSALARRRVTHLAESPLPPIATSDAELCLGSELGARLDPNQKLRLDKLIRRSGNTLVFHLFHLADQAWPRGILTFRAELENLVEQGGWTIEPHLVEEALEFLSPQEWCPRFALLALLLSDLRSQDPIWQTELARLWRRIVPAQDFAQFLQFFEGEKEIEEAAPKIQEIVLEEARLSLRERQSDLHGNGYWPTFLRWPSWLRWLADRGQSPVSAAVGIENLVDEAGEAIPRDVAADWYRELAKAGRSAGSHAFAYRLLLQKWALLGEDPSLHRARLSEVLQEILEGDGAHDEVLRRPLSQPRSAPHLWEALGDWLLAHSDPDHSWHRWLQLMDRQSQVLTAEQGVDCGRFLARLALSTNAPQVSEASQCLRLHLEPQTSGPSFALEALQTALHEVERLTRGSARYRSQLGSAWDGLVQARLGYGDGAPELNPLDPELMRFLFRGLISYEKAIAEMKTSDQRHALEWMVRLQRTLGTLLRRFQDEQRLPRVISPEDAWRSLLWDELLRYPPQGRWTDDSRYVACVELCWLRWSRSQSPMAGVAIRRLIAGAARVDASDLGWHWIQMKNFVPAKVRPLANQLLRAPADALP